MFFVIFWTALVRYTWLSNSSRFFFRQSVLSDVFGLNGRHHWQLRCGAGGCRREATWISNHCARLHEPSAEPVEHLSRTQLVSHMHRDYLYGKLSDYHFIRLHFTTIFDGITTISFWWWLKVLDNKFCHGFNSSCSGIFTFNGFNSPFQPELSERRAPCRHVTIMDLHSHILEIQLMPCHTFVLIKTRRFSFVKTLQNIQSLHSLARALGWTCGASVADSACFTYA